VVVPPFAFGDVVAVVPARSFGFDNLFLFVVAVAVVPVLPFALAVPFACACCRSAPSGPLESRKS
jgi:hypothetical protein